MSAGVLATVDLTTADHLKVTEAINAMKNCLITIS